MTRPRPHATPVPAILTMVIIDWVDSTSLNRRHGDPRWVALCHEVDAASRSLLAACGGTEINRSDGYLLTFESSLAAVHYCLDIHAAVAELSRRHLTKLEMRAGIHRGQVYVSSQAGVPGASSPIQIDGIEKAATARVMSLAGGAQTLMSRAVFDVARAETPAPDGRRPAITWLSYGFYLFKGFHVPTEVCEAGYEGLSPLSPPGNSAKAERVALKDGQDLIGDWRPGRDLQVPSKPDWVLRRRLGQGGYGEVWLAERAHLDGLTRALKFCFDVDLLNGLKREVTIVKTLSRQLATDERVAWIQDWNFKEPPFFVELEYTPLGSLADYARSHGGLRHLSLKDRVGMMAPLADILGATHEAKIVHRDIKPSNVLVKNTPNGGLRLMLTDFGLGTVSDQEVFEKYGVTLTGMSSGEGGTAGTRDYMAPELLQGSKPDRRSDVYAFGITLYQVVTGDLNQFPGEGWKEGIPSIKLRSAISMCLDHRPEARLDRLKSLSRLLADWRPGMPGDDPRRARLPSIRERLADGFSFEMVFKGLMTAALVGIAAVAVNMRFGVFEFDFRPDQPQRSTRAASPAPSEPTPAPTPSRPAQPTPLPAAERVSVHPYPPVRGEFVEIRYNAEHTRLAGAREVYLYPGYNGWQRKPPVRPLMTRIGPNLWSVVVPVPLDCKTIELCFSPVASGDGHPGDNDDGRDWHFTTVEATAPTLLHRQLEQAPIVSHDQLAQLADESPLRFQARLTGWLEPDIERFPTHLSFVDDAGKQWTVINWSDVTLKRRELGIQLVYGSRYEIRARKRTFYEKPQLLLEVASNLLLLEPPAPGVIWTAPYVPLSSLSDDLIGLRIRTVAVLGKPFDPGSRTEFGGSRLVDPANLTSGGVPLLVAWSEASQAGWNRLRLTEGMSVEVTTLVRRNSVNLHLLVYQPEDIRILPTQSSPAFNQPVPQPPPVPASDGTGTRNAVPLFPGRSR